MLHPELSCCRETDRAAPRPPSAAPGIFTKQLYTSNPPSLAFAFGKSLPFPLPQLAMR